MSQWESGAEKEKCAAFAGCPIHCASPPEEVGLPETVYAVRSVCAARPARARAL